MFSNTLVSFLLEEKKEREELKEDGLRNQFKIYAGRNSRRAGGGGK